MIFHTAIVVVLTCPKSFTVSLHWNFPVKTVQIHKPSRLPVGSRTCCRRESLGNWLVCLCFQLVLHSSVGFNFWNMQHFFTFWGSCVGFFLLLFLCFSSPKRCWNESAKVQLSHHCVQQTPICSILSLQVVSVTTWVQSCWTWRRLAVLCCFPICN